jgi:hypothetical protein
MRHRSEWREFGFALHQIQNVIEPGLPLAQVLNGWNRLAAGLAESHRNRAAQDRDLNGVPEVHQMPIASSQPLRMMNSVTIRSSSLAQVAYDGLRAILQIEFRDGTVYQYVGVPLQTYHDLLRADSKGAYFNQYIRSRFPHAVLHLEVPSAPACAPADPGNSI